MSQDKAEGPPVPLPTRYFVKELVSNKLWSTRGYPIPFEEIGDDMGLLVTDHPVLIQEIEIAIRARRGGVYEVAEGDVAELKKKVQEQTERRNALVSNPLHRYRTADTAPFRAPPNPTGGQPAPAADVSPGQPLDPVPTIDPALLRPRASRKKQSPEVKVVVEPPKPEP